MHPAELVKIPAMPQIHNAVETFCGYRAITSIGSDHGKYGGHPPYGPAANNMAKLVTRATIPKPIAMEKDRRRRLTPMRRRRFFSSPLRSISGSAFQ